MAGRFVFLYIPPNARRLPPPAPNTRVGILVNLGGYAGTSKSADVFALRPAPVAVSYMGFPGTMGSVEMVDYILADGTVIPPDLRRFYSEKVGIVVRARVVQQDSPCSTNLKAMQLLSRCVLFRACVRAEEQAGRGRQRHAFSVRFACN